MNRTQTSTKRVVFDFTNVKFIPSDKIHSYRLRIGEKLSRLIKDCKMPKFMTKSVIELLNILNNLYDCFYCPRKFNNVIVVYYEKEIEKEIEESFADLPAEQLEDIRIGLRREYIIDILIKNMNALCSEALDKDIYHMFIHCNKLHRNMIDRVIRLNVLFVAYIKAINKLYSVKKSQLKTFRDDLLEYDSE